MLKKVLLHVMGTFLAVAVLLGGAGCGKSARPEARVLFIGLDGIEMEVLKPLLRAGRLPNLGRLIDRGVFGYLKTFRPTYSPVVWTSIATGKAPTEHRILGFLDLDTNGPYTSNARRGKAIWNILGDYGLTCNVTGYWITYPAEAINGHMVSQVTSTQQYSEVWKGMLYKDVKDATYPPEFIEELWPVVEPYQTQEYLQQKVLPRIFGDLSDLNPSYEVERLIRDSLWSFAGDFVYFNAAKYILQKYPADLDMVYLGGTDVIAHRFWRYRRPDIYAYKDRIQQRYIDAFKDGIDHYYEIVDDMVGRLVALVPEDTRIFILSDHGMHADFLNGKDDKGKPTFLSAHHLDGPPGILIAAGRDIRKGPGLNAYLDRKEHEELGTVLDVTPTILYLLDIPVGRDMKYGKVMKNVVGAGLLDARPVEFIDSHDVDFRPPTASRSSRAVNQAFVSRFKDLGYIDGSGAAQNVPTYRMGKGEK